MNPSDEINNEMLTAYFDGELSQAEQLQVEQALFGCPESRRQLRQWAVLRQGFQQWSEGDDGRLQLGGQAIGPERREGSGDDRSGRNPAEGSGGPLADDRIAALMARVMAAHRDGAAPWSAVAPSPGARVGAGESSSGGEIKVGAAAELDESATTAQGMAGRSRVAGGGGRALDGWLSDYRRLTPRQRMRRWSWQLGSAVAAAAALLLTVWLNPWSARSIETAMGPAAGLDGRIASEQASERGRPMASAPGEFAADVAPMMADAELAEAGLAGADTAMGGGLAPMMSADGTDDPVLAAGAPMGVAGSVGPGGAASADPPLDGYTAFLVYDAVDQTASLETLQTVLAQNSLTLTEVFQDDGNPAVVVSGDTRQLAEVMEAFQTQGEHRLAFVSKIDNGSGLPLGGLPAEAAALPMESMLADGPEVGGGLAARGQESSENRSSRAGADGDQAVAAVVEGPLPSGTLGMAATEAQVAASPSIGGVEVGRPESVLNSQLRQDIIRSQANLLANSLSPPTHMTLEEFLRERPNGRRPRIPFEQVGQAAPGSVPLAADQSRAESGSVAELGVPGSVPAAERSVLPPSNARMAMEQKPGSMAKAVAPSMMAERGAGGRGNGAVGSVELPSGNAPVAGSDAASAGEELGQLTEETSSQAQIVVIIRGQRPRVQESEPGRPASSPQGPQD